MTLTFATRIQDLVGTAVTDDNALTEWLTEEAVNAIDIMNSEMLVSASSTHRMKDSELFNDSNRNVGGSTNHSATLTTLPTTSGGSLKVGDIIASKSGSTTYSERMKVLAVNTNDIEIERAVNGTTADIVAGGRDIIKVLEHSFNTRKFKLLEVNRDGYSAKLIPSGLVQQSNDPNSIHFATKRSPAYFIKSGNIYIRPFVNGYEQGEIIGLVYPIVKYNMKSTTDLPIQAEDFIVIGAARKYLVRSMYEEFAQLPAGITKPSIAGTTEELTTTLSTANSKTDFSDWFEVAGDMIQTDEDVELASAQLQKIGTYIQTHQEELSAKNTVFSSALQRASTKYNWFIAQYDKLTQMYNEKAQILRGVQPQA